MVRAFMCEFFLCHAIRVAFYMGKNHANGNNRGAR